MNSRREMAAEALVSAACGILIGALVAGYLLCRLMAGTENGEPAPYSVCECCGQALDGTNDVCVPEGIAEGSGR